MLIGLKLLKQCIVAIEMADGDGSLLTALVIGVEPRSTFTFTRGFSYITSILIYARKAS